MQRILLDTHFVIEMMDRDYGGLSEQDEFELAVGRNSFFVSILSLWEVEIKSRSKKLALPVPLSGWSSAIRAAGGILLAIEEYHILADIGPEPPNRDPFDRLLLSTAAAEGCKLLTRDRALQSHPLAWQMIA